MPAATSLPICIAVAEGAVRRGAVEVLSAQGYRLALAGSYAELVERAGAGVALAVVDPGLAGLGTPPMERLRAASALHSCPLILIDEGVRRALRPRSAAPALIRFMVDVYAQVAGRAMLDHLHHVSEMLHASPAMDATMDAVLRSVALVLRFDTGTLFMLDASDRIEPRAARGYELAGSAMRSFEIGVGVVGWVVANRAPTIVGDSDFDGRFDGREERSSRSLLAVPVMAGDRVLGALSLVRRTPGEPFGDQDLVLAATIGNYAAIALENARRYEQERALERHLDEIDQLYMQERSLVTELQHNNAVYASVVSTVSHELKTPLFGIQGFARLMMDGHAIGDDVRDFATEIHDNAIRLAEYVERILSEDSLHRGRVTLDLGAVRLRPLVDGVLRSLASTALDTHRLVNDVPAELPPVRGDPDRIVQIIVNLVGNALKYSPGGGRVGVWAQAAGSMVEVVVEDEGIGVPPAERSRIFERFVRVASPQTRGIGGTGIGLAIVRGLVELHGGRVWVDDAPVRGSRFHVQLPQAVPSPPVPTLSEVA